MRHRDIHADIPISSIIEGLLTQNVCFYSVNHPTSAVFAPYADMAVKYLEKNNFGLRSGLPTSYLMSGVSLAQDAIYPVYSQIAVRHNVPSTGSYAFKPIGAFKNPISLNEFLKGEYEAFQKAGRDALSQTVAGKQVLDKLGAIL